jgi:hypothetical protein
MASPGAAPWFDLALAILATWRLCHLVAREDGPFDLILRLRLRAGSGMVARLLDCPNVISFKAASGTTEEVSQLRALCGQRLAIYSGDDALTLPMLAVGAVGVVSVASHLAGPEIRAMVQAFLAGENSTALALHEQLLTACDALGPTARDVGRCNIFVGVMRRT